MDRVSFFSTFKLLQIKAWFVRLSVVIYVSIQLKGDLVTASPDVFQVDLGSDAEFVVLASDGLWDYIKR